MAQLIPCLQRLTGRVLLTCVLGAMLPAAHAGTNFEDGRAAYQAGDYEKALSILKPLAEDGNSQAQVTLGIMYDYGQGVEKDTRKAMEWYIKAAEQGIPVVQHDVGVKYFQGNGVEQDYLEAAKWWELSANAGLADSQFNLGLLYYRGLGLEQDYEKAAELFHKAADQGHSHAQYSLAVMNAFGNGMEKDYAKALKWFMKSADQGVAQAQFNLGVFYENGYGLDRNLDRARKWYKLAADQGLDEAKRKLAELDSGSVSTIPEPDPPALEATAAKPPAEPARPVEVPEGINSVAWVESQSADDYTMQLSSMPDEQSALKFIRTHKLTSGVAYFRVLIKGSPRYTVIYGVYDTYDNAKQAVNTLPASLQNNKPWVRNFGQLHKLIRESR